MEKTRNTGIDFLRILSMLLAVILHVQGHGAIVEHAAPFSAHEAVAVWYHSMAYCAVNIFGLISGYVMVSSGVKLKNLILLWMQVFFYSFGITLLAAVMGWMDPDRTFWLESLFPVFGKQYWYFTAYFGMMLLAPAAVYAVNHMPKKLLRGMLIALAVLVSAACTLTKLDPFRYNTGYAPAWLLVLFLAGGYIRKHGAFTGWSSKKLLIGYLVFTGICWGLTYVSRLPQYFYAPWLENLSMFTYTSPTALGAAVMLFLCCERHTFGSRVTKLTKMLSPFAFGVYLVHVHPVVWQQLGWRFHPYLQLPAWLMALAVPLTAAAIYLAGTLIDWLRSILFRVFRLEKLAGWLAGRIASVGEWIGQKCE
ncbi:MAG: acyltransferase [Clostridia bacterium]|nr:acyltransferase [Clostridia bacterium]